MSTYDTADAPRRHKSHRHHHHRDREDRDRDRDRDDDVDAEARYVETRETYVRGTAPVVPDSPYQSRGTDLIHRPGREESDLSIEEVRRDFPPPAGAYGSRSLVARDDRYGPPTRSRSMERGGYGDYLDDPRDERRSRKKVDKEVVETRRRSLSRNQKILAGVAGAALAVGGKELWDRRQNHGQAPEDRNILGTAAIAAGGAFAGYEGAELYTKKFTGKEKKEKTYMAYKGRDGETAEYYSEESEAEKPKKSHRKTLVEGALSLAGIGAAGKALTGGHHVDDRSDRGGHRSRRRSGSESSGRSRRRDKSRGGEVEGVAKFQQAAKAALLAGAAEAFRVRKEPGGWSGAKGKRVLTAAIGAGSIDAAADKNPDHHGKRHILEAVIGGLAGNRLINGSRHDLAPDDRRGDRRGGRSRSRSRASSTGGGGAGLAALATAGLGALAGKKLLDNNRSRSRGPDDRDRDDKRSHRRRSPSQDSYDSRDGGRDRDRHRRSKSVTDYARKGLAAFGIGEAASEVSRDDRRRDRDIDDTRSGHKSRRRGSDDSYDDRRESTRGDPYDDSRNSRRRKDGRRDKKVAEGKQTTSDSDSLGSSSGDEKRVKKMKAHNVYQSYEKREARKKAVASGEMTAQEARKLKSKAVLQDAASIGIAALGIKGAFSEWKEMTEMRHEYKEFAGKKAERHQKRVERQKHLKGGGEKDSNAVVKRRPESGYSSAPDLPSGGRYADEGPNYADGNPYASGGLPAPPIGYAYAPRR